MFGLFKKKEKIESEKTFVEDFKIDLKMLLMNKGLTHDEADKVSEEMIKCARKKVLKEIY